MSDRPIALVADDHELFRAGLAGVLKNGLGFSSVVEAGSLDDAIEQLGRIGGVTFASFDLNMAGVASAASLHGVRAAFPNVRIAVVAGSTRREDVLMALAAGVHGYIPKSLTIDGVVAAIRLVLAGQVYVPSFLSDSLPSEELKLPEKAPEKASATTGTIAARAKLTRRQRDVLTCIAQGKSNKEIARILDLADGTVKVHVAALFRSLGVHNRVSAAAALTSMGPERREFPRGESAATPRRQ